MICQLWKSEKADTDDGRRRELTEGQQDQTDKGRNEEGDWEGMLGGGKAPAFEGKT